MSGVYIDPNADISSRRRAKRPGKPDLSNGATEPEVERARQRQYTDQSAMRQYAEQEVVRTRQREYREQQLVVQEQMRREATPDTANRGKARQRRDRLPQPAKGTHPVIEIPPTARIDASSSAPNQPPTHRGYKTNMVEPKSSDRQLSPVQPEIRIETGSRRDGVPDDSRRRRPTAYFGEECIPQASRRRRPTAYFGEERRPQSSDGQRSSVQPEIRIEIGSQKNRESVYPSTSTWKPDKILHISSPVIFQESAPTSSDDDYGTIRERERKRREEEEEDRRSDEARSRAAELAIEEIRFAFIETAHHEERANSLRGEPTRRIAADPDERHETKTENLILPIRRNSRRRSITQAELVEQTILLPQEEEMISLERAEAKRLSRNSSSRRRSITQAELVQQAMLLRQEETMSLERVEAERREKEEDIRYERAELLKNNETRLRVDASAPPNYPFDVRVTKHQSPRTPRTYHTSRKPIPGSYSQADPEGKSGSLRQGEGNATKPDVAESEAITSTDDENRRVLSTPVPEHASEKDTIEQLSHSNLEKSNQRETRRSQDVSVITKSQDQTQPRLGRQIGERSLDSYTDSGLEIEDQVSGSNVEVLESIRPLANNPIDPLQQKAVIAPATRHTKEVSTADTLPPISTTLHQPEDDNASVVYSYASSVFSVLSIASTGTDFSRNGRYTADEITTATKKVVQIFHKEDSQVSLYVSALKNPVIGPAKLEQNLRRLFKQCAEDLKNEASDQLEYLGARLVSHQARALADILVSRYSIGALSRVPEVKEESSDEEETSEVFGETVFADVLAFITFLENSEALQKFRERLGRFVSPDSALDRGPAFGTAVASPAASGDESVSASESISTTVPLIVDPQGEIRERTSKKSQQETEDLQDTLPGERFPSQLQEKHNVLDGAPKPPKSRPVVHTVQLRWKCVSMIISFNLAIANLRQRCKKTFKGNVTEQRENGILDLVERMERSTGSKVTVTHDPGSPSPTKTLYRQITLQFQDSFLKFISRFKKQSAGSLPHHNGPDVTITSLPPGNSSQQRMLHLLACMHANRFRKSLAQDRVESVTCDRKLFTFMRDKHSHGGCRTRLIPSLNEVRGIFFVKFRLPLGKL
jgi:hypothetical protein